MADWLHCNTCFLQPCAGHQFFLTSCGHIYCGACVKTNTREKCKMCGQPCTTITLSANMKPDVEIFFTDPGALLKKHLKQVFQVMDFQKNHRERLTAHNMEQMVKQDLQRSKAHELEKENQILKKLINQMGGNPNIAPGRGSSRSSPSMSPRDGSRKSPFAGNESAGHTPGPPLSSRLIPGSSACSTPLMPARLSVRGPPRHGRMGTIPGRVESPDPSPSLVSPNPYSRDGRNISSMNVSPAPFRQPMGARSAPLPPTNSIYALSKRDTPRYSDSPLFSQTATNMHSRMHYSSQHSALPRNAIVSTSTSQR